jgi:hypothetical protein
MDELLVDALALQEILARSSSMDIKSRSFTFYT